MKTSESTVKIDAALAKCQGEIKHAAKNASNPFFKSSYADLPSVRDAAQAAMLKHGIALVCTPTIIEVRVKESKTVGPQSVEDVNNNTVIETERIIMREVMVGRIVHDGEWYEAETFLKIKDDDSPQSFGSATTYARRYLMCSLLNITADGEDDDGESAEGRNAPVKPAKVSTRKPAKKVVSEDIL